MKKIIVFVIAFIILFQNRVYANTDFRNSYSDKILIFNFQDGRIIFSKNIDVRYESPASKRILIAMLAYDFLDKDKKITLTKESKDHVKNMTVSSLKVGESFELKDMIAAMLFEGGNDIVVELSIAISRIERGDNLISIDKSKENLLKLIKNKFKLEDTYFSDILDDDDKNQYSTLKDEMQIILKLKDYPEILDILAKKNYKINPLSDVGLVRSEYNLKSTNKFINIYSKAVGIDYKIYNNQLVTTLNLSDNNGYKLCVLTNSNSLSKSINDTLDIFNSIYNSSSKEKIIDINNFKKIYSIQNENKLRKRGLKIIAQNDLYYDLTQEEHKKINYEILFDSSKLALTSNNEVSIVKDIKEKEEIGRVQVKLDGHIIGETKLLANSDAYISNIFSDIIYEIFFIHFKILIGIIIFILVIFSIKLKLKINKRNN